MKVTTLCSLLSLCLVFSAPAAVAALTPIPPTETKLVANDAEFGDEFGNEVAIQGNIAVIGSQGDRPLGFGTGAAYVFEKTASGWQQLQKLTSSDSASHQFFGVSVAIDGDRIVIGAWGDQNAGVFSGAAYVFARSGSTWVEEQKLTGSENSFADGFGKSVAIEGDTIVVGAFGNSDVPQTEVGSAYVFRRTQAGWVEQQELTASDAAAGMRFALSVDISNGTIVAGGDGNSELGFFSGAVYVFTFDGSSWVEEQKLQAQDAAESASFGYHVAISGDTIVAGAPGDIVGALMHGAAYVFSRKTNGWSQDRKLVGKDTNAFDGFGLRVAIDADTIVVGSPNDSELAFRGGSAYVYKLNGQSGWSLHKRQYPSDPAKDDTFGLSVAASGNTVLVGAPAKSDIAFLAGAAYVYEF
ncbi:MAG TPA: FG-GAP repeat protein [Pyrinomonadaceae bacterium]|nr:FG-GAP repeat protein [Pyrinomonadaceae bacterium]